MTRESIRSKLSFFDEIMAKLEQLPRADLAGFMRSAETLPAALYLLQVSIQVLIDLATFVAAQRGLRAAATSREVFQDLEGAGFLPVGTTDRFGPMIAFRNRIVHLYDRTDPSVVLAILQNHRNDLLELRRLLVALL